MTRAFAFWSPNEHLRSCNLPVRKYTQRRRASATINGRLLPSTKASQIALGVLSKRSGSSKTFSKVRTTSLYVYPDAGAVNCNHCKAKGVDARVNLIDIVEGSYEQEKSKLSLRNIVHRPEATLTRNSGCRQRRRKDRALLCCSGLRSRFAARAPT